MNVVIEKAQSILRKYWGYDNFRPDQAKVVSSVLSKSDTLALLPTGGGKSICYQAPGLVFNGLTIVVTPLIALMNDQVEGLKKRDIPAVAITSDMNFREVVIALENAVYKKYKFLYASPERIASELFQQKLCEMDVSFFAIDEAHCISQWGFDFRPSYLGLSILREIKPRAPILALTASAPSQVISDIEIFLKLQKSNIIRGNFERKNLSYYFIRTQNKLGKIKEILNKNNSPSSIIYGYTRKEVKQTAMWLQKQGIKAGYYHGGLSSSDREKARTNWMNSTTPVMCATNAFGMGIDKPDVKFVFHQSLPLSIEAYYQEAGRAGRNGDKAWAITLFNPRDVTDLQERLNRSYPELPFIKRVYKALANYYQLAPGSGKGVSYPFEIAKFSKQYNFKPSTVYNAIKFLEKEGYVSLSESARNPSKVFLRVTQNNIYGVQVKDRLVRKTIEILLRSYSGLFDEYTTINENIIAQRAGISRKEVVSHLRTLARLNLLNYREQNELPYIFFTEEIISDTNFRISPENYHHLKQLSQKRLDAFIEFITTTNQCRNQVLMRYFEISSVSECGICDICLKIKQTELSGQELYQIKKRIMELYKAGIPYTDIVSKFNTQQQENALKLLIYLRDEGIID